jgi:hypothetical protein
MNLPTQHQVLAATRNIASFAAGAIAVLGLSSKINTDAVIALITSLGTLVNDAVVVIGLITPLVAAWLAGHSASARSQIAAVQALPEAQVVVTNPKLAEGIPGVEVR